MSPEYAHELAMLRDLVEEIAREVGQPSYRHLMILSAVRARDGAFKRAQRAEAEVARLREQIARLAKTCVDGPYAERDGAGEGG